MDWYAGKDEVFVRRRFVRRRCVCEACGSKMWRNMTGKSFFGEVIRSTLLTTVAKDIYFPYAGEDLDVPM